MVVGLVALLAVGLVVVTATRAAAAALLEIYPHAMLKIASKRRENITPTGAVICRAAVAIVTNSLLSARTPEIMIS